MVAAPRSESAMESALELELVLVPVSAPVLAQDQAASSRIISGRSFCFLLRKNLNRVE